MFPSSQTSNPPDNSQLFGNMLCFPCTDIKAGPGLMDTLLPSTISSIANLSSCMKDSKNEDGCECASSVVNVTRLNHCGTGEVSVMKLSNGIIIF